MACLKGTAHICDAGVTGLELQADLGGTAIGRGLDRVSVRQGDIAGNTEPCDVIWSAGSLCFPGVIEGLRTGHGALSPGGAAAFSEWAGCSPDPAEDVRAFGSTCTAMTDRAGIAARVRDAGWETLDTRMFCEIAREACFGPMEARPRDLPATGGSPSRNAAADEILVWRKYRRSFGYLLSAVRPA